MENYAMINGKRVKLTDEQLKLLGIEVRKNPFERVEDGKSYSYIDTYNDVGTHTQCGDEDDIALSDIANYFSDKGFANHVALHQLLYRKLLKFAYDNECEDTAEWNGGNSHWYIRYSTDAEDFEANDNYCFKHQDVYFSSKEAAERAIKEVVEPFVKEHPGFVW